MTDIIKIRIKWTLYNMRINKKIFNKFIIINKMRKMKNKKIKKVNKKMCKMRKKRRKRIRYVHYRIKLIKLIKLMRIRMSLFFVRVSTLGSVVMGSKPSDH